MELDGTLLEILACPVCLGGFIPLESSGENREGLFCPACQLIYPVRENIPVLLQSEAVSLKDWADVQEAAK